MRRLIPLILPSILLFPLAAQTGRASLTGVVMDSSRSVVPGARIASLHHVGGRHRYSATDAIRAAFFVLSTQGRVSDRWLVDLPNQARGIGIRRREL